MDTGLLSVKSRRTARGTKVYKEHRFMSSLKNGWRNSRTDYQNLDAKGY